MNTEYAVYIDGNVIHTTLAGMFDVDSARAYCEEVEQCVLFFEGKPFCCLVDGIEAIGGLPAAFDILEQHNLWLNQQNLKAKAIVLDDEVTKQSLLKRSPSMQHDKVAFFANKETAVEWLNAQ